MSDGIFVRHGDQLVELQPQPYDTESVLQLLLAKYPNLLVGGQMNRRTPRRWLLVSRETAVPSEQDGADRWSLDHLFLDQDAIPTFVEVKRSSDTRIRREVVGQMLDYAANAVAYWPLGRIRNEYESRCRSENIEPDQPIESILDAGVDIEQFWLTAQRNLEQGRIRMVFVADVIPTELQRIVEFLNAQMSTAEVVAVEIKQFVGEGLTTFVPRVVGQSIEAEDRKLGSRSTQRQWNEESYFNDLQMRCGTVGEAIARRLLAWAKMRGLNIWWGRGNSIGSFIPTVISEQGKGFTFGVWTSGSVDIQFQHMKIGYLGTTAGKTELLERLNRLPGMNLPLDTVQGRPSFPISLLAEADVLRDFIATFDWVVDQYAATVETPEKESSV